MSLTRRIYRRVTVTERIVLRPEETRTAPIDGDTFRVEVFVKSGSDEKMIYERDHSGTVAVEELDGGNFILTGEVSCGKGFPRV